MVKPAHVSLKAYDRSYFAILKKEIHALAVSAGFSKVKIGHIDIIVAEMVSNLVKHAGGGDLLVNLVKEDDLQGIEIISIDKGPGMADVTRMVSDGVSTKNTLGQGLGAIKRLSDLFQVYTLKDWGTVILIRVFEKDLPAHRRIPAADIKSVLVPKPGETECGDGFFSIMNNYGIKLMLGDGLGHGREASAAVNAAGNAFLNCEMDDPVEIIRYMNTAVKKTRGLVAAVAVYKFSSKTWSICGVGNITTRVNSIESNKTYTPYNGIIGLNVPNTLNSVQIQPVKGDYLVMHSDGLKSKWELTRYPAILRYDLSVLCAVLLKDFARQTDDMSIIGCKINT
jgi:anti-sigma regulatory factor (Ser/Thr protein kinase)